MKSVLCAMKDLAAQTFSRPVGYTHPNAAIREFSNECNRAPREGEQLPLWSNPDDFELYALGEYDDSTGRLEPYEAPRLLVQAKHISTRATGSPSPSIHLNGGTDAKAVVL